MPSLVNSGVNTSIAGRERADALEAAKKYAKKSRADSTWRAYAHDWQRFEAWCQKAELIALPADAYTLALFLAREADMGKKPSTLQRRLSAIRMVHKAANLPSAHGAAQVTEVIAGIRRAAGAAKTRKNRRSPQISAAWWINAIPQPKQDSGTGHYCYWVFRARFGDRSWWR